MTLCRSGSTFVVCLCGMACLDVAHVPHVSELSEADTGLIAVHSRHQPALAVAGPERRVIAAERVCLAHHLSMHPLDLPFITTFRQVAGPRVAMDANDCFTAPQQASTLTFVLTADDGAYGTQDVLQVHVVPPPEARAEAQF